MDIIKGICLLGYVSLSSALVTIHCNYKGQLDASTQSCTCISGWTGPDCSQKLCQVGYAWTDYATAPNKAHARLTECSNMGYCDRESGECICRDGFEGAGCQYMSCPKNQRGQTCSNNGKCLTMREAAAKWDGRNLLRPDVIYDNWDADQIQGCVCDVGYSGHDCSVVECPRGDDPKTTGQINEKLQIACYADGGYWFLSFRGATSRAIPYDAGYGSVERILESMGTMDDVMVTFSDTSGLAPACNANFENLITIEFLQDNGPLPVARIDGSRLTHSSSTPKLEMLSQYQIVCDGHANGGVFYILYDDDISDEISYQADASELGLKLRNIKALGSQPKNPYGNVSFDFGFNGVSNTVCSDSKSVTNFTVRATYGNLMPMEVINSIKDNFGKVGEVNLTITALNRGTKENTMCNNHGECDEASGTCKCSQRVLEKTTKFLYKYTSSNGEGELGTKGDCGHEVGDSETCPYGAVTGVVLEKCSRRGVCINSTKTCDCFEGYHGTACDKRYCPMGPAWFDEATSTNTAHALAECSNRGKCDSSTGTCMCDPLFEGANCARLRCATTVDGEECSGHGKCLPMWQLALEAHDVQGTPLKLGYGTSDDAFNPNFLWDREMVRGCHCDTRNDMQPHTGPKSFISGVYVDNPSVGGWTGYDCSRKWCPTGDDPLLSGDFEEQTIVCKNSTGNFTVSFRGETSDYFRASSTLEDFKVILKDMSTIGEVDVTFPQTGENLTICHPTYGDHTNANRTTLKGVKVTFYTELGDLPMLEIKDGLGNSIQVNQTVRGTKLNAECSNRGICDYDTGMCQCMPGFSSSAGNSSTGLRRDCGRRADDGATLNPYYT